jgi:hypothetical protein
VKNDIRKTHDQNILLVLDSVFLAKNFVQLLSYNQIRLIYVIVTLYDALGGVFKTKGKLMEAYYYFQKASVYDKPQSQTTYTTLVSCFAKAFLNIYKDFLCTRAQVTKNRAILNK